MSFKTLLGQSLAVCLGQRWLERQTTQPLLLYGPEGVGKRSFALELAKALNCSTTSVVQGGCDRCASCRKVMAGGHPDIRVIDLESQAKLRGETLDKQQSLRIETILAERRRLLQSSVEGAWKVMILDEAHRLTANAANVLLKILEEPPSNTAIFLVTPFRDRLFPTVVSRCQPIRFRCLSDEEMQHCAALQVIPEEFRMRVIELACGSPGRALHMNRDENIQASSEAETLWQALSQPKGKVSLPAFEPRTRGTKVNRNDTEERIKNLLFPALRDLRAGHHAAQRPVELILHALQQLRRNVQPGLVYDHLLLQLSRQRSL